MNSQSNVLSVSYLMYIKHQMILKKISQTVLSEKLGVSQPLVSHWFRQKPISTKHLTDLQNVLFGSYVITATDFIWHDFKFFCEEKQLPFVFFDENIDNTTKQSLRAVHKNLKNQVEQLNNQIAMLEFLINSID